MLIIYIYIKYIHACILFLYKTANPGLFTRIIIQPPYTYIYIQLSFVLSHISNPLQIGEGGGRQDPLLFLHSRSGKRKTRNRAVKSLSFSPSLFLPSRRVCPWEKRKRKGMQWLPDYNRYIGRVSYITGVQTCVFRS